MRARSIVDIELDSLEIDHDLVANMGLARLPTWSEVFIAVRSFVEATDGRMIRVGEFDVALIPGQGKCALYAGLTASVLHVLLRNPIGVFAGAIAIGRVAGVEGYYCLPKDQLAPNGGAGGYHAWTVIEHGNEPFLIDMSYHWFAQKLPDCAGPSEFIVARPATLEVEPIYYRPDTDFTREIAMSFTLDNLREPTREVLWTLHRNMNGEL